MARISKLEAGGSNMLAFLDTIALSELGAALIKASDDGYNVIVGSTAKAPILFNDYSQHPGRLISPPLIPVASTAAGRYQILARYAKVYIDRMGLRDFGPISQDKIAIQLLRECKAIGPIERGEISTAIRLAKSRWASFPAAGYGQREHKLETLLSYFVAAGGKLV